MKQYLELGKVNNTHGLRGEVKFEYWCDDIDYIRQLKRVYLDDNGEQALTLSAVRPQKNNAILQFAEITSIEQAEPLKGKILYCNRDDAVIDEDKHYLADIIGCRVVDADTEAMYGTVCDIMNYGSCDIYDVQNGKKHTLIPAIDEVIREIDTQHQIIRILPMKGLFDEN